jgi:hypothetical protein
LLTMYTVLYAMQTPRPCARERGPVLARNGRRAPHLLR